MAACAAGFDGALETLGIGIACCLADAAGGVDLAVDRCSAMQRKLQFGQYLDLLGRGSRQWGHSVAPQLLQIDLPGGIGE